MLRWNNRGINWKRRLNVWSTSSERRCFTQLEYTKTKLDSPMANSFDPSQVEKGWHSFWTHTLQNTASPTPTNQEKTFSMVLPPPNITGALHIGHALTVTIQDALARWHRMRGCRVLWIPGLDHAGIATQTVVEKKLKKERNVTRHDLGRDQFLKEVWKWNDQHGKRILEQLTTLGATLNWEKEVFTMDKKRTEAVNEAFVRLYNKGLIYRKRRMVNWCPYLRTALSDIEVENMQVDTSTFVSIPGYDQPVEVGVLYRICYKVVGGGEVFVDTSRPETLLGDVAVAIHPDDPRYRDLHGKSVVHPLTGDHLPIVLDSILVDMEMGTGAVKITPAHDMNDYECSLRHNLPEKCIMDLNGKISGNVDTKYVGLDRFQVRKMILDDLSEQNLYIEKNSYRTTVSRCSRSGDLLEPFILPQWFVDCEKMATVSSQQVENGEIHIFPKNQQEVWFRWLNNIHDWCISRQLWWGHRIPAYRVKSPMFKMNEEVWVVATTQENAIEQVKENYHLKQDQFKLEQDEDVLDTWFSSSLYPLTALGWPSSTTNIRNHHHPLELPEWSSKAYPLNVMETGSDILFFWVARMSMICNELVNKKPFETIFLHPVVRDKTGKKMSKSLGNVIDPVHVIQGVPLDTLLETLKNGNLSKHEIQKSLQLLRSEFPQGIPECGTDALRFCLSSYLKQEQRINMDIKRVIGYRLFCNKIWNAVKFALPHLMNDKKDNNKTRSTTTNLELKNVAVALNENSKEMGLAEKWILSRMAKTILRVNDALSSYCLSNATDALHEFFLNDFCDKFIEFSKPSLYQQEDDSSFRSKQNTTFVLSSCLDLSLRLMHPFMPFITEELWQRIHSNPFQQGISLCEAEYPSKEHFEEWINEQVEAEMKTLVEIIHSARSIAHLAKSVGFLQIPKETTLYLQCDDESTRNLIKNNLKDLLVQCRIGKLEIQSQEAGTDGMLVHAATPFCRVCLPLTRTPEVSTKIDLEVKRLRKKLSKAKVTIEDLTSRLTDSRFLQKATQEAILNEKTRREKLESDSSAIQDVLETLENLQHYFKVNP